MSTPTPSGWGTATGLLTLESAAPAPQDPWLRIRIAERIHTYAWGFDERRHEVLRSCFTDDAVWHGSLAGREPVGPVHGADAIIDFLTSYWPRQTDQRRHLFASLELDPVEATEILATASLLLTAVEQERLDIVLTSFYRFRLVLRDGVWLIAHLFEGGDVDY
jgi:hypothetical protein